VTTDERALALARRASGLAAGAGVVLPDDLLLWSLAGGRPTAAAVPSEDPGADLGAAMEATLTAVERRRGAHYTPAVVAERAAALALGEPDRAACPAVVDPTCGGGALLLAAGRRLVAAGTSIGVVAAELLWGADVDPLAAAVTEAAITLWSGGTAPGPGHVVVGDTLADGARAWPAPPLGGFDALVGNPPFQGQLGRGTARTPSETAALRDRFGPAISPYVDTAAVFLLAGSQLLIAGGRLAMVLPQSVAAARDAGPVREALAATATLGEVWVPEARAFGARVDVCVLQFELGAGDQRPDWAEHLAAARGVPPVTLPAGAATRARSPRARRGGRRPRTVRDLATAVAAFRDEYYGLAAHIREAGPTSIAPLVTSGLVDVGTMAWGERRVRFAKQVWDRPEVDLAAARAHSQRVSTWLDRVLRPKVVVASQTRIVEAAPDHKGTWVPSTPAVGIVPLDPADVPRLVAALCAPPVSAWAVRRAAGTALSPDAIRVSADLLLDVPLPRDADAWAEATALLAAGDLDAFACRGVEMYDLAPDLAGTVRRWWSERVPVATRPAAR
jgi:hypothetical protein